MRFSVYNLIYILPHLVTPIAVQIQLLLDASGCISIGHSTKYDNCVLKI